MLFYVRWASYLCFLNQKLNMLTLLCAFHGRHQKVERVIRCFVNQDYSGEVELLLYNNSNVPQILDYEQIMPLLSENKNIKLVNNHLDLQTGQPYTNVGDIFRDALTFVDKDTEVLSHSDSDDLYLPNHASEGMRGYRKAVEQGKLAYKPYYSYYLYGENKAELSHNTMEPSFFINFEFLKEKGYLKTAASYNQGWETPLNRENKVLVDRDGIPTLIYDWSKGHNTHKISGLGDAIDNFEAHRQYENNHGDGILSCAPQSFVEKYYNLALNVTNA